MWDRFASFGDVSSTYVGCWANSNDQVWRCQSPDQAPVIWQFKGVWSLHSVPLCQARTHDWTVDRDNVNSTAHFAFLTCWMRWTKQVKNGYCISSMDNLWLSRTAMFPIDIRWCMWADLALFPKLRLTPSPTPKRGNPNSTVCVYACVMQQCSLLPDGRTWYVAQETPPSAVEHFDNGFPHNTTLPPATPLTCLYSLYQ